MPQIILMQPGLPVASFSVDENLISIAGVAIDAAERQQDVAVYIDVRGTSTAAAEGGDGPYLAQIHIPARRYEEALNEEEETVLVPQPLDSNAVEITLWPIG